MTGYNSGQVQISGISTLSAGLSDRAFQRADSLTMVANISVAQAMIDADVRFHLLFHLVDRLGVFTPRHWSWGFNQRFQWGRHFWASLTFDRVGDMDVGGGRARALKASIYLRGTDEFAVSEDHYVLFRTD